MGAVLEEGEKQDEKAKKEEGEDQEILVAGAAAKAGANLHILKNHDGDHSRIFCRLPDLVCLCQVGTSHPCASIRGRPCGSRVDSDGRRHQQESSDEHTAENLHSFRYVCLWTYLCLCLFLFLCPCHNPDLENGLEPCLDRTECSAG